MTRIAIPDAPTTSPFDPPPLAREESTLAKVLGIVAALLGALVALSDLWEIAALVRSLVSPPLAVRPPGTSGAWVDTAQELQEAARQVAPLNFARSGVMLMMSVALVAIGIGLVGQREWARKAAIGWGGVALVVLALRAAAWELVTWPRYAAVMQAVKSAVSGTSVGGYGSFLANTVRYGEYGTLLILLPLPVLFLVVMNQAALKEKMR